MYTQRDTVNRITSGQSRLIHLSNPYNGNKESVSTKLLIVLSAILLSGVYCNAFLIKSCLVAYNWLNLKYFKRSVTKLLCICQAK